MHLLTYPIHTMQKNRVSLGILSLKLKYPRSNFNPRAIYLLVSFLIAVSCFLLWFTLPYQQDSCLKLLPCITHCCRTLYENFQLPKICRIMVTCWGESKTTSKTQEPAFPFKTTQSNMESYFAYLELLAPDTFPAPPICFPTQILTLGILNTCRVVIHKTKTS